MGELRRNGNVTGDPNLSSRGLTAGSNGLPIDFVVEIVPIWVRLLNKPYFPRALPFLQPLLAPNRIVGIVKYFEVDESIYAVFFCEPVDKSFFVLVSAVWEISRHPYIQCAVLATGHDVNEILLHRLMVKLLDPAIKSRGGIRV